MSERIRHLERYPLADALAGESSEAGMGMAPRLRLAGRLFGMTKLGVIAHPSSS
jgi:hypothetical protein